MSVLAQLQPITDTSRDRRRERRMLLRLDARVGAAASAALVHDISRTGLLFETPESLSGDMIQVELPGAPAVQARIVWSQGHFYGCKFEQAIPAASVSAALLRSQAKPPAAAAQPRPLAANDPVESGIAAPTSRRGWVTVGLAGALLVGGAAALILTGQFDALVAIGVGLTFTAALVVAAILWALDHSRDLSL